MYVFSPLNPVQHNLIPVGPFAINYIIDID